MKKKCFLGLLFLLILLLSGCQMQKSSDYAEKGHLDLQQINFDSNVVTLDGEWEFYWNKLLEPSDFNEIQTPQYVKFPASWTNYSTTELEIPGYGFATYRLTFDVAESQIMALRIPKVRTAYNLYINGELISNVGEVGESRQTMTPQYLPQLVSFISNSGENEIVLQVSNFFRPSGGLMYSISIGSEALISATYTHQVAYEFLIFGALLMMGIYHLTLFLFSKKDISSLYFGLLSILVSIRTLLVGTAYLLVLFPSLSFEFFHTIQTSIFYLCTPLIIVYLSSILPGLIHQRIIQLSISIGVLFTLIVLLLPSYIFSVVNPVYQAWSIFLILYVLWVLIKLIKNDFKEKWLVIIGSLALILTSLIDILYLSPLYNDSWPRLLNFLIQSDTNSSTGQFIFVVCNAILLAKNFSEAMEYKTSMSEKLKEINVHLDEVVMQRTEELTSSNKKIELQNSELERMNRELQNLSFMDSLTGVWNRRKFNEVIESQWEKCKEMNSPISLQFIDVDYFKRYNDTYGHIEGDECLRKIGNCLKTILARNSNMVFRYGGEEFIIIIPNTDCHQANLMADRLLYEIEKLAIPNESSLVTDIVTVSIGISTLIPDDSNSYEMLLDLSDQALYTAKDNGRNRAEYISGASLGLPVILNSEIC